MTQNQKKKPGSQEGQKSFKKLSQQKIKITDKDTGYGKTVLLKQFCLPNGLTEVFFIDEGKDSVQIFAITQDKKVILVKQFRAGTEKEELELPGGGLEPNENLKSAAKRELEEETGFSGELEFLCSLTYGPYSTGIRHTFIANSCNRISDKLDLDPNEFLSVHLCAVEKFRELLLKGTIRGIDVSYMALDKIGML